MTDTPALVVQDVHKHFGRFEAVRGISFSVQPGEFIGFVGPNGAGKSTTIKMLTGQLMPTSGTITVGGASVSADPNAARAQVGYVPEEPKLYDYLNAREMIEFVVQTRGRGDTAAGLELTGLGGDAERLIQEYSQGMRRKTAIACAMVAEPAVLILDESLNGLDPPSAARMLKALDQARARGAAVVLSTHVLDTLEKVATRIIMIRGGEIVADVPASELDAVRGLFD
ncbi:MAG: ABC-2 type transport system ATP-binding protein [Myxococcota bacterium]